MKFVRVFTKDSYSLNWTKRDARICDEKGNIVFEQKGVEAPESWSDNAVNIVASKYFKKINGIQENSVKQLIDRVLSKIAEWGDDNSYFDTEEDEFIFIDELKYLLTTQHASFNSPIWFNFGVPTRSQQAAACFLIGLEDSMESIDTWMHVESRIFQGGSGSGTRASNLRCKNAPIKAGGFSSGPLAFMKASDYKAGAIKSGGTTRRAAKLVAFDINHPDIREFVNCKTKEEEKAKVLIAAGYDPGIEGEAYTTVAFQNTNHSVQVDDVFMNKVSNYNNPEIGLHSEEELKASELMKYIAQHAWESGDPGLQFIDTINKWNSIPNSGPITTSNPSMPAGVLVHTDSGIFPIETLENKFFRVRQLDGTWSDAKCFLSGKNKEIFKITFRTGTDLFATSEHRWPVLHKTFYKGKCTDGKIIKLNTSELSPNDRIPLNSNIPLDLQNSFGGQEDEGFLLGYLVGDGWFSLRTKGPQAGKKVLGFVFNQDEKYLAEEIAKLCNYFSGYTNNEIGITTKDNCWYVQPSNKTIVSFVESFGIEAGLSKKLPSKIWESNDNFIRGFIDGLFSSDGHVDISAKSIRLTTSREILADEVIKLLSFYGIRCSKWGGKPHKHGKWPNGKIYDRTYVSWTVAIDYSQINKFANIFSFSHVKKQEALESLIDITREIESIDSNYQIIEKIEPAGTADVWDISVFGGQHLFPIQYCYTGNCGEYLSTDWSSCLLASFNLLKFYSSTMGFDYDALADATHIMTTAMDIIICGADYPDDRFKETAHNQRQIGLGYSNLGALLMSMGLPYGSEKGRREAAEITSCLTAEAYYQSALIAKELEPFKDYKKNEGQMLTLIALQSKAASIALSEKAASRWDRAYEEGMLYGYRNATVSLLAPTGTISFMMDCDTTGLEPKFSLMTTKSLVGGGHMNLVDSTVQTALENLGYFFEDNDKILDHIENTGTIENCNLLKLEHLPIFDCAVKPQMGVRYIAYQDHMKMMSAIQPFLSMGISKTINMPNLATVDDIYNLYIDGWKMGLKSITVYRDGCKQSQPLNVMKSKVEEVIKEIPQVKSRRPLPDERKSLTHKIEISGFEGYMHVGMYEDGTPGEVFINASKQGSTVSGLLDAFATAISYGLQYGVPLEFLVEKFSNQRFEPSGFTKNPTIPLTTSIVDYIFKWLKQKFVDNKLAKIKSEPILLDESSKPHVLFAKSLMVNGNGHLSGHSEMILESMPLMLYSDHTGETCTICGSMMVRTGTCLACHSCGQSVGGCGG